MKTFKPVTHVIFDMDGLLLDTESIYTKATQLVVDPYGKVYTNEVKRSVMGTTNHDAAKGICKALDLPMTPEQFQAEMEKYYEAMFPLSELMPGVEKLINHLHDNNIPFAIATSASKHSYDLKTKNHQALFAKFHHVVAGSSDPEVVKGKPAPDIYLICAGRFPDKPSPDKILVFEDATNGVKAGLAAAMQVVWVPDERFGFSVNDNSDATQIMKSIVEFRPEDFGLPPYKK